MMSLLLPCATIGVSLSLGGVESVQPLGVSRSRRPWCCCTGARVCVCGGWRRGGCSAGPSWVAQYHANSCATSYSIWSLSCPQLLIIAAVTQRDTVGLHSVLCQGSSVDPEGETYREPW